MIRLEGAGWRFPGRSGSRVGLTLSAGASDVLRESASVDSGSRPTTAAGFARTSGALDTTPTIGPIDLVVNAGELVLLTGPTGCGKSTVLRLAAGLLQRHGRGAVSGRVTVDGVDPATMVAGVRVRTLGFVGQDPDDGVVCSSCDAEVAFALESAGASADEIATRVPALLERVGLGGLGERAPHALSGGQRQRLVIAAALAAGARALLLDEPLSQLDPDGAREVVVLLRGLADEGVAVLCVEHRLELAMPLATRTVLMEEGRIVADPLVDQGQLRERGLHGPALEELRERVSEATWGRVARLGVGAGMGGAGRGGLGGVGEGGEVGGGGRGVETGGAGVGVEAGGASEGGQRPAGGPGEAAVPVLGVAAGNPATHPATLGPAILTAQALAFAWPGGPRVVRDVSLTVSAGERVAIVGGNGAGKSTLIGLLAGRLTPLEGRVIVNGSAPACIEVPQNPDLALFCASVAEELAHGPVEHHAPDVAMRVSTAASALSVAALLDRPPQALSRGQRLRTAVAAAVACQPAVLLLDEPTSGQDRDQVDRMLSALADRRDGCLVFASHDLDVVLRHATRVVVMEAGAVVADGPPLPTLAGARLALPPLAELCLALGVPYGTPEDVARSLEDQRSPRAEGKGTNGRQGSSDPRGPSAAPSRGGSLRPLEPAPSSDASSSGTPPASPWPGSAPRSPGGGTLDPRAAVGTVFLLGVLVLCLDGAVPLAALALVGSIAVLTHPRAAGWRLRFVGGVALLAWTTAFSQGLFWSQWPRTPLIVLSHEPMIALYREGLVHGLVQSLRFTAVTAAGVWVALTTSPDRLITGMLALRFPFGVALMGATALRFLPMVGAELLAVRGARARRGRPVWKRSPWAWMELEVSLLRPVVARALRRARTLAESLETRGFHPTAPRAVREPLRMRAAEGAVLAVAGITALSAVIARALYAAYGAELYYAQALRPLYAFVRAWM